MLTQWEEMSEYYINSYGVLWFLSWNSDEKLVELKV